MRDDPIILNNPPNSDEQLLQDIILEMVTSALRSSTNQLNGSRYADFPKFIPSANPAEPILPVHYDSMVWISVNDHPNTKVLHLSINLQLETRLRRSAKDKKLLVKIVKANNLGSQRGN